MIRVRRRQDHLRRYAALGIGASISAGFITGLGRHSGSVVDDALFEVGPHVTAL